MDAEHLSHSKNKLSKTKVSCVVLLSSRSHISAAAAAAARSVCSHQSRLQKSAVCVWELQCTSVYLPLQDLYAAGEGKVGTDEEKIIKILGNRSVEHLREGESVSLTGQNSLTVWKQHTFTIYSSCSLLFHLNSPDSICKGPLLFR